MGARVVVYPSHYEGFGLPVVDALALGKPVVVLDAAINRELSRTLENGNLHLVRSLSALESLIDTLFSEGPGYQARPPRRWGNVAEEYTEVIRSLLEEDINIVKLRLRWHTLRLLESVCSRT
jgi:glycosyltransferase involved in cell wall biosynthesis